MLVTIVVAGSFLVCIEHVVRVGDFHDRQLLSHVLPLPGAAGFQARDPFLQVEQVGAAPGQVDVSGQLILRLGQDQGSGGEDLGGHRGQGDRHQPAGQTLVQALEHNHGEFLSLYADLPRPSAAPRAVVLLRDSHTQIVELGRHHCRKTAPRCAHRGLPGWTDIAGHFGFCAEHCANNGCQRCPLAGRCDWAQSQAATPG